MNFREKTTTKIIKMGNNNHYMNTMKSCPKMCQMIAKPNLIGTVINKNTLQTFNLYEM